MVTIYCVSLNHRLYFVSCNKCLNSHIIHQNQYGLDDTFKQVLEKCVVFMTTVGPLHENGLSKRHIHFSSEFGHKIQRSLVDLVKIKKSTEN